MQSLIRISPARLLCAAATLALCSGIAGAAPHAVAFKDGPAGAGLLFAGASFSPVFDQPGSF